MRKKFNTNIILAALLLATIFTFTTCIEEVKNPCEEGEDIALNFKGMHNTTCDESTTAFPANNAEVFVFQKNNITNLYDTLIHSFLNNNGELTATFANSSCGLSNLYITATYNGLVVEDSIDFMCCTKAFPLNFNENCDQPKAIDFSCESLSKVIDLKMSDKYAACLLIGTKPEDIEWNRLTLESTDKITVDLTPIVNLEAPFTAQLPPNLPADGKVALGDNAQPLNIDLFVDTKVVGDHSKQVVLPVTCNDSSGNVQTGEFTINISALVCDDDCVCPFSDNPLHEITVDKTDFGVLVGETETYQNLQIIKIDEGLIDATCYLNVTDIKRYNSTITTASIPASEESIYDWTIPEISSPIKLNMGETLELSPKFRPEKSGESADTFEVYVDVYNKLDFLKGSCSFLVILKGLGCENVCPEITLNNSLPAQLTDAIDGLIGKLRKGDVITMSPDNLIKQNVQSFLGNLCGSMTSNDLNLDYTVEVPKTPGIVSCSNVLLTFDFEDDGQVGDKAYFSSPTALTLVMGMPADFSVKFLTPSMQTYLSTKHDSIYKAVLNIRAHDLSGNFICEQQIKVSAEVNQSAIQLSEATLMKSFSQVSDVEPNPSYMVYKIDKYDERYHSYGEKDNLSPLLGDVNLLTTPPTPETDHSFYFEVPNPTNKALLQTPKLFLVESRFNNYSKVTAKPIAQYSRNSDFINDLPYLVDLVFKNNTFQPRGTAPVTNFTFNSNTMWEPSLTADELFKAGGIDLQLGEVYIIWNPDGNKVVDRNIGGSKFSNYCEVAFLYIDGLSDGSGTNHHIGNVSFYVAYPLSIIKE
jgi:hypothetical protein